MWDGTERRKEKLEISGFCPAHIDLVADIAVIKASTINIEKVISQGTSFKNAMTLSLLGIVITILLQIAAFAYLFGQLSRQVEVNTDRLNVLEDIQRGEVK